MKLGSLGDSTFAFIKLSPNHSGFFYKRQTDEKHTSAATGSVA